MIENISFTDTLRASYPINPYEEKSTSSVGIDAKVQNLASENIFNLNVKSTRVNELSTSKDFFESFLKDLDPADSFSFLNEELDLTSPPKKKKKINESQNLIIQKAANENVFDPHINADLDNVNYFPSSNLSDSFSNLKKLPSPINHKTPTKTNPTRKTRLYWTERENQNLIELVKKVGRNWNFIADKMGRTPHCCSRHFLRVIRPKIINHKTPTKTNSIRKTRLYWTEEEDHKLIELVREHGKMWTFIAILMQTRNSNQCQSRARYLHI